MFYHNKFGQNLRKIFDWNTFLMLTELHNYAPCVNNLSALEALLGEMSPLFASALHQLLVSVFHNFLLTFVQI